MSAPRVLAVIPARLGSSRFPGKPLAPIQGRPMIEHVYRGTAASSLVSETVIATCDEPIASVARAFGARAVMTGRHHERASDRVAEACAGDSADLIVMVQGDEPMVDAQMIEQALAPLLSDPALGCTNLMAAVSSADERADRNTIKVVTDDRGRALYFSRTAVPSASVPDWQEGVWFKQVCIFAFRRAALEAFTTLPPGRLERLESIDMLRFLEHGMPVQMVLTPAVTHAVDVPADIPVVESLMAGTASARAAGDRV